MRNSATIADLLKNINDFLADNPHLSEAHLVTNAHDGTADFVYGIIITEFQLSDPDIPHCLGMLLLTHDDVQRVKGHIPPSGPIQ